MVSSTDLDAAIVLSRFGLGATPAGTSAVGNDPRGALAKEIRDRLVPMPQGEELKPTQDLLLALFAYEQERKLERQQHPKPDQGPQASAGAPAGGSATRQPGEPVAKPNAMAMAIEQGAANPQAMVKAEGAAAEAGQKPKGPQLPQRVFLAEVDARFNGTIDEPTIGFGERLAMFWANHFAVAVNKGEGVRILAGAFEREAIRPHIFGKFSDMLLAVETHPAMLFFLDNAQSIGPDSKAGINRHRGLNENLARETMELHTLGVDGGYSQADVTSLARIITGWTVARQQMPFGSPGNFVFNPNMHEPGAETVLGHVYDQAGFEQGKAALLDLARHPATAQHIATQLVQYFIADVPPPDLVKKVAKTFHDTDGDLQAVYLALVGADAAWDPKLVKVRSPLEFMVALLRATDERPKPQVILGGLNAMGQPFWMPSGPNGFSTTADAWASSEGLSTRIDVAAIAANAAANKIDPRQFVTDTFGALASDATKQAVARAETRAQGLSIAFLSPEFQRR